MDVLFLVPGIHDRPTGGNIYNRRIIERLKGRLRDRGGVDVVAWPEEGASPDEMPRVAGRTVVVDSLLLRPAGDALSALLDDGAPRRTVLLAHALNCIDPTRRGTRKAREERRRLSLFDAAVTTSRFARDALRGASERSGGALEVRCVVPGLDDAYRDPVAARSDGSPPGLLTVASVIPGKGLKDLVEALGRLESAAWTARLIGDDTLDSDFTADVDRQIASSPVSDRIDRAGPVRGEAIREAYDRADLFVLPSAFETCSMATREAMARGLPVVASKVGGLPENFGNVRAGRLVLPGDPEGLAAAIRALIDRPSLCRQMGDAGRARSHCFPSWEEAAGRFARVLRGEAERITP